MNHKYRLQLGMKYQSFERIPQVGGMVKQSMAKPDGTTLLSNEYRFPSNFVKSLQQPLQPLTSISKKGVELKLSTASSVADLAVEVS